MNSCSDLTLKPGLEVSRKKYSTRSPSASFTVAETTRKSAAGPFPMQIFSPSIT